MMSYIIIILITVLAAYLVVFPYLSGSPEDDGPGSEDGQTDGMDEATQRPLLKVNLSFLDDTKISERTYQVDISGQQDYGVVLLENVGSQNDSYTLDIIEISHGWEASFERQKIDILSGDVETSVIMVRPGEGGISHATIRATSSIDLEIFDEIILEFLLGNRNEEVAGKGVQVMVEYYLTDPNGNHLDDGTLPAIAGEPEAGPAGELTYIEGFYMGLLGMGLGGGIFGLIQEGETKTIRVPPQLGYGNSEGHELQETTLIFTLTILVSER